MAEEEMKVVSKGFNPWIGIIIVVLVVLAGAFYFKNASNKSASTIMEGVTGNEQMEPVEQTSMENEDSMMEENGATVSSSDEMGMGEDDNMMEEEDDNNVKTIKMEGGSYYFKPDKITVKQGDRVKIELTAVDKVHNFYLDEFNVKGPDTKSGETTSVEFTADKKGTFEFYCAIGQHRQLGMVGTLTVE